METKKSINKNKLLLGDDSNSFDSKNLINTNPLPTNYEINTENKKQKEIKNSISLDKRENKLHSLDDDDDMFTEAYKSDLKVELYNEELKDDRDINLKLYGNLPEKVILKQLKTLENNYKGLKDRLEKDLITSEVEKDRSKRAFLNVYRQQLISLSESNYNSRNKYLNLLDELHELDIKVSDNAHKKSYISNASKRLYDEDKNLTKYNNKIKDEKNEKKLTDEQLIGINAIDRWLMDNTNNGGVFGSKFDQFDFVSELLQMSDKDRLYVYYLVESNERKNAPSADQYGASQGYTPNVDNFSKIMKPTKLKFYKYFNGKYVYWHKLGEAVRHARFMSAAISNMSVKDNLNIERQEEKKEADDNNIITSSKSNNIIIDDKKRDIIKSGEKEFDKNVDVLNGAVNDLYKYLAEHSEEDLLHDDQHYRKLGDTVKNSVEKVIATGNAYEQSLIDNNIRIPEFTTQFFQQNGGGGNALTGKAYVDEVINDTDFIVGKTLVIRDLIQSINWGDYYNVGSAYTTGLLSTLGAILALKYSAGSSSWSSFVEMSVGLLSGISKIGLGISNTFKLATEGTKTLTLFGKLTEEGTKITDLLPSNTFQYVGAAVGGVTAIYGTTQIVSGLTRKYHVRKAEDKLLNGENTLEQRYARGMTNIARYHAQKKANDGGIAFTLGIATLGTSVLPGIGTLAGLCIGAVGFGIGMIMKIVRAHGDDAQKDKMVDEYFNMETIYKDAIEKYNAEHPQANDKIKNQIRKEVRKKMMAKLGFARQRDAANYIAAQYATIIKRKIDKLPDNSEEKEGYIQLVKALGLHYNKDKNKPALGSIISKLSA